MRVSATSAKTLSPSALLSTRLPPNDLLDDEELYCTRRTWCGATRAHSHTHSLSLSAKTAAAATTTKTTNDLLQKQPLMIITQPFGARRFSLVVCLSSSMKLSTRWLHCTALRCAASHNSRGLKTLSRKIPTSTHTVR